MTIKYRGSVAKHERGLWQHESIQDGWVLLEMEGRSGSTEEFHKLLLQLKSFL